MRKLFLTVDEALSILLDGDDDQHTFVAGGAMLLGADTSRAVVEADFRSARSIEVGGDLCRAMQHPLGVTDREGHLIFYRADMDKLAVLEAAKDAEFEASLSPEKIIADVAAQIRASDLGDTPEWGALLARCDAYLAKVEG